MQAFSLPARSLALLIDDEFNAPTLDLPPLVGMGLQLGHPAHESRIIAPIDRACAAKTMTGRSRRFLSLKRIKMKIFEK